MSISISRQQRDALYRVSLDDLSVFFDLQRAYQAKTIDVEEACYRHGRRMLDALRLIQDGGLGWGEQTSANSVELKLPVDDLGRILTARKVQLLSFAEASRPDREATEAEWDEDNQVIEACENALAQIETLRD